MPVRTTHKNKTKKSKPIGVVDPSVKNYGNDPFFVTKANEVRALIKEVGLPKEVTGRK